MLQQRNVIDHLFQIRRSSFPGLCYGVAMQNDNNVHTEEVFTTQKGKLGLPQLPAL